MHYFIIMELVSGGELFNAIVDHTYFSEPLARHIINQVAEGIHYLHSQRGVVHRDIKPENILFEPIPIIEDPQPYIDQGYKVYPGRGKEGYIVEGLGGAGIGRVKIADFGLSKTIWSENTMTPCGTVGYTAPEIVNDQRYSLSVDLWALGCVLYTMLCGFPPFYDEDIQVLTEKVARGFYTFLSPWWDPVSDGAKDLVAHLLLVDPINRYTIDEFMCHPWCRIVNPPSPPTQQDLIQTPTQEFAVSSVITPSVTLREAFDVSYAVHLMGDDHHREIRAKNMNQRRQQAPPAMIPIVETPTEGTGHQGFNYEAANLLENLMCREAKKNGGEFKFALNADNATLLNRRKNKTNKVQQVTLVQA
jgi:serine/threonine protein kinase